MRSTVRNDKFFLDVNRFLGTKNMIPFFLDVETPGDYVFKHYRTIWQTKIYQKFIKGREEKKIKVSNVVKWVQNHSGLSINTCFEYEKNLEDGVFNLTNTVYYYFKELEKYKILDVIYDGSEFGSEFEVVLGKYYEYNEMSIEELEKYRDDFERKQSKKNNSNNNLVFQRCNEYTEVIPEDSKEIIRNVSKPKFRKEKEYICKYCGELTSNWNISYGDGKYCKCRNCRDKD